MLSNITSFFHRLFHNCTENSITYEPVEAYSASLASFTQEEPVVQKDPPKLLYLLEKEAQRRQYENGMLLTQNTSVNNSLIITVIQDLILALRTLALGLLRSLLLLKIMKI